MKTFPVFDIVLVLNQLLEKQTLTFSSVQVKKITLICSLQAMSHPACQHSLECLTRERLTMNRARSLLRTRGIHLGYSFEPRHNSRALATGGLVLSIGSSIKDARTRGNQFDQFGLRRPHRFDVIQAEPHESSLLFLTQEGKTNFCSHGGYDPLRKCSG